MQNMRAIGVGIIACIFIGALARVWALRSESFMDGPGFGTQITEFGQFAYLKKGQTFHRGDQPRVDTLRIYSPLGLGLSASATMIIAYLVLELIAPGILDRANGHSLEWRRLAILGLLAVAAGTVASLVCGFLYPIPMTQQYLVAIVYRAFFIYLIPAVAALALLHLLLRKVHLPRLALLVVFVAAGLIACKLTNSQWWSIAIVATISLAAWVMYVAGPLRVWRPR
jgi:hypothetical protein